MKLLIAGIIAGCSLLAGQEASAAQRWAVVVGVNDKEAPKTSVDRVQDAVSLAAILIESAGFPPACVSLLTSESEKERLATGENIRRCIAATAGKADAVDCLLVFLSCRCVARVDREKDKVEHLLIPAEGAIDKAVPLAEIVSLLDNSRAKTKLLILDCWHGKEAMQHPAHITSLLKGRGVSGLLTCSEGERSRRDPRSGGSVAMTYLLDALEGHADGDGDRTIAVSELHGFLQSQLADQGQKDDPRQTPVLLPANIGQLPIAWVTPMIRGKVIGIDLKLGLAVINVGRDERVTAGSRFSVRRAGKYVATLVVDQVFDDMSACTILAERKRGDPKIGDEVFGRPRRKRPRRRKEEDLVREP